MNCVRLFLVILLTVIVNLGFSAELNCTEFSLPQNDYNLQLSKNNLEPEECSSYKSGEGIPTIRITKISLTGANFIVIRQGPNFGVVHSTTLNSSNYQEMVLQLEPTVFIITFSIVNNTENDFFNMEMTYANLDPVYSSLPDNSNPYDTVIIDSITLRENTRMQVPRSTSQRVVVFDGFNVNLLKKYYVYSFGYAGTLYGLWKNPQSFSALTAILNANPTAIDGFVVLLDADNCSYKCIVQPLPITNTLETLSSLNATTVFREVTSRSYPLQVPTVIHDISLTGSGTVSIYAGCSTYIKSFNFIGSLNSKNQKNFENLSIHGRCRTYVVENAQVQWKKTSSADTLPNAVGQQGVVMSPNYPFPEDSSPILTQSINNPKNTNKFSVTYNKGSFVDNVIVEFDGNTQSLPWNQPTTIESKSSQVVKANTTTGGCLVRFTVNSSQRFISFLSIVVIFLLI